MDASSLLATAVVAAEAAGDLLLSRFRAPARGVERKSSTTDMVSDADRDAEAMIREILAKARPDDAILGEEEGERAGASGLRWVIDPLDGTTNFLFGLPQWCVSVACEDSAGGLVGVVHDPCHQETFVASRGNGAFLGADRLSVSEKVDLSDALIATGYSYLPEERAAEAVQLERVLPRVRDIRRLGSAALDLAWTAGGRFDGYYETPTHHWDWAAGVVLVREAGGLVGELPAVGPSGPGLVAAGNGLYDALVELVT